MADRQLLDLRSNAARVALQTKVQRLLKQIDN